MFERNWYNEHTDAFAEARRVGQSAEKHVEQLEGIEQDIQQDFAEDAQSTLERSSEYRQSIRRVKDELARLEGRAKAEFLDTQLAYRQALQELGGAAERDLWSSIIFSSSDPNAVYQQLYSFVNQHVSRILDDMSDTIERRVSELAKLAENPELHHRGNLPLVEQTQERLGQLNAMLSQPFGMNTLENVRDFDGQQGKFSDLMVNVDDLRTQLELVENTIRELRTMSQTPSRSHEAERVYQALEHMQTQSEKGGDLTTLRQEVSELSEEVFWKAIRELWDQHWLELIIALRTD